MEIITKFEKVSKIILFAYFNIILFYALVTGVICCFYPILFPDYDTAFCWLVEIISSGLSVSGAVLIPVFIFEIMSIYFGLKTKSE